MAIERTKQGILAECQRAAGGDWNKWDARALPFRKELRASLQVSFDKPLVSRVTPTTKMALLSYAGDQTEWGFANTVIGPAYASPIIGDYATKNRLLPIAAQLSQ